MIIPYCYSGESGVILAHGAEARMDLFINAALTAGSFVRFCYWFRYGCLLILTSETPHD